MEPLFLAVICGCNAGLLREALHEVYIPRIQRRNDSFAANILGARGPLLSVLIHFFEDRRWGSPVQVGVEGQSLTEEDQLFILMQAAQYLTSMRGMGATEPRICYERAEPLCGFAQSPPPPVRGAHGSVPLFAPDGQVDSNNADCRTNFLAGARAE